MQDRSDAGQVRCMTGQMQEGQMQDRSDAGQVGCRTGQLLERRDAFLICLERKTRNARLSLTLCFQQFSRFVYAFFSLEEISQLLPLCNNILRALCLDPYSVSRYSHFRRITMQPDCPTPFQKMIKEWLNCGFERVGAWGHFPHTCPLTHPLPSIQIILLLAWIRTNFL